MGFHRREVLSLGAAAAATLVGGAAFSDDRSTRGDAAAGAIAPGPLRKRLDIVFEGGGVKGFAFAGALRSLEKGGYTFRRMIGSSAGAIAAACLAAGHTADSLRDLLSHHNFRDLLEPPPVGVTKWAILRPVFEGLLGRIFPPAEGEVRSPKASTEVARATFSFLARGAIADEKRFLEFMDAALSAKEVAAGVTLKAFHEARLKSGGKQLSLVATDVTAQQALVLNERTAPDVPLIEAVRMSMGIPFIWPEKEWRVEWGATYRGRPMRDGDDGHRVVDGGVLSNFPLRFLLEPRHRTEAGVLGSLPGEASPLGLLLDESLPREAEAIEGVEPRRGKRWLANQLPAVQTASRVLNTMLGAWDAEALNGADRAVCRIPVKGVSMLDFGLEDDEKQALFASGEQAMTAFLEEANRAS